MSTDDRRDDFLRHDQQLGDEIIVQGERLVARTHTEEWARVRVTRRIVTENRTITVPVRREELVVEYLDEQRPEVARGTVHGSTEAVGSAVVEEFTLLEEVPEVVMHVRPHEKVQLIVDTQRSLVEFTGDVRREQVEVAHHDARPAAGRTELQVEQADGLDAAGL